MSNPTAERVLKMLADWIEAEKQFAVAQITQSSDVGKQYRRATIRKGKIFDLDPAHLRTLAQAHADQQARLVALVGKWRGKSATDGLFIDVAFPGDTVGRIANQQRNRCADELEAALGGKE